MCTETWVSRLGAKLDPQNRVFPGNSYICDICPFPCGTVTFLHGGKGRNDISKFQTWMWFLLLIY